MRGLLPIFWCRSVRRALSYPHYAIYRQGRYANLGPTSYTPREPAGFHRRQPCCLASLCDALTEQSALARLNARIQTRLRLIM